MENFEINPSFSHDVIFHVYSRNNEPLEPENKVSKFDHQADEQNNNSPYDQSGSFFASPNTYNLSGSTSKNSSNKFSNISTNLSQKNGAGPARTLYNFNDQMRDVTGIGDRLMGDRDRGDNNASTLNTSILSKNPSLTSNPSDPDSSYKEYKAHRVILAARSEYFRALLYNDFRENTDKIVDIHDLGEIDTFKDILDYCYTGTLDLTKYDSQYIIEIVCTAHQFGITDLINSLVTFLLEPPENVRTYAYLLNIFLYLQLDQSEAQNMKNALNRIFDYLDNNAQELLSDSDVFNSLTSTALIKLLSRSSFYAKEIHIFNSLVKWRKNTSNQGSSAQGSSLPDEEFNKIMKFIRFELMEEDEIFNQIRKERIVHPDVLLDSLESKRQITCYSNSTSQSSQAPSVHTKGPRGVCIPNIDLATEVMGAEDICGEMCQRLIKKPTNSLSHDIYNPLNAPPETQNLNRNTNTNPPNMLATNDFVNRHRSYVAPMHRDHLNSRSSLHDQAMTQSNNHRGGSNGNSNNNNNRHTPYSHLGRQAIQEVSVCARHRLDDFNSDETSSVVSSNSRHNSITGGTAGALGNSMTTSTHEGMSTITTGTNGYNGGYNDKCLIIKLGKPSFVNIIRMKLHIDENNKNSYSYKMNTSIDGKNFIPILNYEDYVCRSNQVLYWWGLANVGPTLLVLERNFQIDSNISDHEVFFLESTNHTSHVSPLKSCKNTNTEIVL